MTATTMRWLILPDTHDKLRRANQIIEREPRLPLMGDFFDDFQTGVTDAADTASQVKKWLNSPHTTCLLGNHDMSYGWCRQNRRLLCPGYDAAKWIAINATVTTRDWQKFALHAWLDDDQGAWLVSHAGVHPVWLEGAEPGKYRDLIALGARDLLSEQLAAPRHKGFQILVVAVRFESSFGGVRCETDHLVRALAKLHSTALPVESKHRRASPQFRWCCQDRASNLDLWGRNLSRKPYRSAHRRRQPNRHSHEDPSRV